MSKKVLKSKNVLTSKKFLTSENFLTSKNFDVKKVFDVKKYCFDVKKLFDVKKNIIDVRIKLHLPTPTHRPGNTSVDDPIRQLFFPTNLALLTLVVVVLSD